jgi:hypothetical protein
MKKLKIKRDCFCQRYLHEKRNYPREGLVEMKLSKGDEVGLMSVWSNFYGVFVRVRKGEEYYDVLKEDLEDIE